MTKKMGMSALLESLQMIKFGSEELLHQMFVLQEGSEGP